MSNPTTLRTPITYYGGKQQLASIILSLLHEHITYVEPFFGGGAVFFAKPKSEVEIINDVNKLVVNFYEQVKTNFDALQTLIRATPHSRAKASDAWTMYDNPHLFKSVQLAWAFYTLANQGYAGKIGSSWGYGTISGERERSLDHKRENFTEELVKRLDRVQIECNDVLHIIKLRDRPTTFFYLDPPYFNSNMGHYGGYTERDFGSLLQRCEEMEGKFLLSSYPSDILKEYTERNGWHTISLQRKCAASKNRKDKVEVLTANYPISLASIKK